MKTTHIAYLFKDDSVFLWLIFRKSKWLRSGYICPTNEIPTRGRLGSILVYEEDCKEPKEQIFLYKTFNGIPLLSQPELRFPVGYPLNRVPLQEVDPIQQKLIPFVLSGVPFKGTFYFKDKKRKEELKPSEIVTCSLDDLPV